MKKTRYVLIKGNAFVKKGTRVNVLQNSKGNLIVGKTGKVMCGLENGALFFDKKDIRPE